MDPPPLQKKNCSEGPGVPTIVNNRGKVSLNAKNKTKKMNTSLINFPLPKITFDLQKKKF